MNIHDIIPGGCHTYSKGDDQFPSNAPSILSHGKGCYTWDINNCRYLDYGMGLRSVTIGYAHDDIDRAAFCEAQKGNNLFRPTVTEYKAAKLITEIIPCAEMVKFAKNGSNVTTAAIKLARAYTGKKYVLFCTNSPFYSFDDWFIGKTTVNRGVPADHCKYSVPFSFYDTHSVKESYKKYGGDIAAIILEPCMQTEPDSSTGRGFLQEIRNLCNKHGSILIFDEVVSGFRWALGGASEYFNIIPDLATFGKGMANGYALAALAGKREIMNLGSILEPDLERTFLLSSTHGAEMSALGAFIKTVEIFKQYNVISHVWQYGKSLIDGVNEISEDLCIHDSFRMNGYPCSPTYCTLRNGVHSNEMRTLFLQEMFDQGISFPYVSISFAHKYDELEETLQRLKLSLITFKKGLENPSQYITSPIVKTIFRKIN